jgi:hypothetical protein
MESGDEIVQVPSAYDMSDDILIKHFQARHDQDVSDRLFRNEPDRKAKGLPPRLREGVTWRIYHDKVHELYDGRSNGPYRHVHKEAKNANPTA